MKTYRAPRGSSNAFVCEDGGEPRQLNPRLDLRNHSPTGFATGYGGSGPAQLALAILCDATGDIEFSLRWYQDFKWQAIFPLPQGEAWEIPIDKVLEFYLERTK